MNTLIKLKTKTSHNPAVRKVLDTHAAEVARVFEDLLSRGWMSESYNDHTYVGFYKYVGCNQLNNSKKKAYTFLHLKDKTNYIFAL